MTNTDILPLNQKAEPIIDGKHYASVLQGIHERLKPETYFEIGTLHGSSLAVAGCASIAVDRKFQLKSDVVSNKPTCQFFQMSSDEFFRKFNPLDLFKAPIDLAFLDGMHLFEFLLRDFINTERCCKPNSIIALHDCLPSDEYMASRLVSDPQRAKSIRPEWWTGDVWKMIPIFQRYRRDLQLCVLDAKPTGLVLISNLDPSNSVLQREYAKIVAEYRNVTLADYGISKLYAQSNVMPTSTIDTLEGMSKYFWL